MSGKSKLLACLQVIMANGTSVEGWRKQTKTEIRMALKGRLACPYHTRLEIGGGERVIYSAKLSTEDALQLVDEQKIVRTTETRELKRTASGGDRRSGPCFFVFKLCHATIVDSCGMIIICFGNL